MAFRLLRELSAKLESSEKELDIRSTIIIACRRGGILDIRMQPPRRNRLKLMVLIDSGGSMRPYEQLCSLLFQSLHKANTFSELKMYYFHNCLEGQLYDDPSIDADRTVGTDWVLRNISGDYKVIFVGDADMAIHELVGIFRKLLRFLWRLGWRVAGWPRLVQEVQRTVRPLHMAPPHRRGRKIRPGCRSPSWR